MSQSVAFKRGKKGWINSNHGSGLCFTLGYDDLERVLKHVRRLKEDEQIERVEISAKGITVFIEHLEINTKETK